MNDDRVAEMLDRLTRSYDDRRGDWNRVASEARATDGGRLRGRPVRAGAVVAVVAAIAVAVLAWPFGTDQPSLLERARAAIGDGPVVHAVLRGEWGGTLIDLTTGERSPVHGENEIWYDSEQGRVHVVSRLGDAVLHDEAFTAKEPPADYAALARDYRRALDSGTARVAGEDTIDGEPVVWVTIRSLLLPDVADGKNHEFAEQVAVSRETHKPVALRALRDRVPNPGTMQRVLGLELLAAGEGDFTAPEKASLDGDSFMMGRTPITLERARAILGHPLLWLGREYQGLPLAQFFEDSTARGERRVVRVTGAKEKAALECRDLVGEEAGTCIRALGLGSVRIGADGVFRRAGRVVWHDEHTGVGLFYGTIGDDPTTYREEDDVPLYDRPNLTVTVSTDVSTLRRGAGSYVPPEGSVFVSVSRDGFLTVDGLHVSITAKDEPAIVAAARALERMPD
jgi:hypothetical protein